MSSLKISFFCSVQLALLLFLSGPDRWRLPAERLALDTETNCRSSGPAPTYTVRVCIVQPIEGAVLTGVGTVSTTVFVTGTNPGVRRMTFYLDDDYLLTDSSAPYSFRLPTTYFANGSHSLGLEALMRDGFTSARVGIDITFNNSLKPPPASTPVLTPATAPTPEAGSALVVAAIGDGAGGAPGATQVTNIMAGWNPGLVLYLGDVYEKGTYTEFYNWYGLPGGAFFGRFHNVTKPAIGNHEYQDPGAAGYFAYWDNIPNYYSFNAGGWHFISLNTTSDFGETATNSWQYLWLRQDLLDHAGQCTIAFFHHPVFSIGPQGSTPSLNDIWQLLADHNVPLVLAAHDHNYQRWHPLDRDGNPAAAGVTQFVVGTGGHGLTYFVRSDTRVARSFDNVFGALRLSLSAEQATYQFINVANTTLDSGTVPCNPAPPPPPAPALTFTPVADTYAHQQNASSNYGPATTLRADAAPVVRSYLRFNVQGLASPVTRATLHIYANSSSDTGYRVQRVAANTWSETALTYNNAPAPGTPVGIAGPFAGGAWTSADVTSLVTGNGLVSLVLTTPNSTAISFASRETGTNAPKLVIETAPASPPMASRPDTLGLSFMVAALTGWSVLTSLTTRRFNLT